ncbi:MAG: hypothetical protein CM1200mP12_20620 [Gammaproteobacteria bacterium]|nr:MAG: hypothetical protein CM1200mP12_20620 [Gammaproteobacteria bacterium]
MELNQHTNSGPFREYESHKDLVDEAENKNLEFLKGNIQEKGKTPLCGNSISHDRRFLVRYMPELANFFHYRNIDVSS